MIKRFYQNVINENKKQIKVLDLDAILKENAQINIILSERGAQGKTTTMFQFIKAKWDKHDYKSILIFNVETMFKFGLAKMISFNKIIYPDDWDGVKCTMDGLIDKNGEKFCYFLPLSKYHNFKVGTRDPSIRYIFWDEIGEATRTVKTKMANSFDSILHSTNPNVRCFLFGNRATISVNIINSYGFNSITKELEFNYIDNLKVLFYVPTKTEKEKRKLQTSKNWIFSHSKAVGTYDMSVMNSADFDNYENVVPKSKSEFYRIYTDNIFIHHENRYIKIWRGNYGEFFLDLMPIKFPTPTKIIVLKLKYIEVGFIFDGNMRIHLFSLLQNKHLYFDSLLCKDFIKSSLFG